MTDNDSSRAYAPGRVPVRCDTPDGEAHEEISSSPEPQPEPEPEPHSEPRSPAWHARLHGWVAAQISDWPRWVSEDQPSLRAQLDHARRGEWTTEEAGPARSRRVVWTHAVWAPIAAAGVFAGWAARAPGRFAAVLAVLLAVCTALNAIPVVGWLVPDFVAVNEWPPITWITGEE